MDIIFQENSIQLLQAPTTYITEEILFQIKKQKVVIFMYSSCDQMYHTGLVQLLFQSHPGSVR